MDDEELDRHLSQISTQWTLVFQAHRASGAALPAAQEELVQRYGRAVYRYLLGALRDRDAADEVSQEFAVRFLQGRLHRADPGRGRFRDYVKTALVNLVNEYRKRGQRRAQPLPEDTLGPAAGEEEPFDSDEEFLKQWRAALLARAWEALAAVEQKTGSPLRTVLHFRAGHPDMPSQQLAEQLSAKLGKPLTAAGVRQIIHRAREKFADLLLDEVGRSLETSAPDRLAEELADLNLLPHCQTALQRRTSPPCR
jgi:RNA polymerase sigma-70 factor (ECF subfamily)